MANGQRQQGEDDGSGQRQAAGDDFAISPPAISLPKGGGAIRGIDEKVQVNPATGTGSLSIPISTSPGRQGFGPQLALHYDSGAGNGPFGLGWSPTVPNISRKTDKGIPRYRDGQESDTFILTGAEDLVPELADDHLRGAAIQEPVLACDICLATAAKLADRTGLLMSN